jgi:hypothetical protein
VRTAVSGVTGAIADAVVGLDADDQEKLDEVEPHRSSALGAGNRRLEDGFGVRPQRRGSRRAEASRRDRARSPAVTPTTIWNSKLPFTL